MNYPHFYITFLFTFLIDVSSVSYIIHHIHYIFIICFYYTMKSCRSWHSYTQILHHIILLFFGFWIPSYLQFLYILINGIHALFINLIEERMLRLFSTFFTSALGLKHFHFYLFWSSFPQNLIHLNWFLEFYSFCSTIHLKIHFFFFSLIEYYFFMKLGACMSTLYTYLKFMLYKSYLSHAMLSRILTPIPKSFFSLQYYGSTKGLRD